MTLARPQREWQKARRTFLECADEYQPCYIIDAPYWSATSSSLWTNGQMTTSYLHPHLRNSDKSSSPDSSRGQWENASPCEWWLGSLVP